ncbi:MAG TPA: transcriptional repressor, partial [Pirellulaceae bacterium]|nr:transcriptional repressor [Pirellulaceae bacterium]
QLLAQLPRRGQSGYVSRPTVYRTLAEFVDAGLLRKLELGGRSVYEHDYGYPPHDHMHCQQCGRLYEFQSDELGELVADIARLNGFVQAGHKLIIEGTCRECRQQQRRQRKRVDLI